MSISVAEIFLTMASNLFLKWNCSEHECILCKKKNKHLKFHEVTCDLNKETDICCVSIDKKMHILHWWEYIWLIVKIN